MADRHAASGRRGRLAAGDGRRGDTPRRSGWRGAGHALTRRGVMLAPSAAGIHGRRRGSRRRRARRRPRRRARRAARRRAARAAAGRRGLPALAPPGEVALRVGWDRRRFGSGRAWGRGRGGGVGVREGWCCGRGQIGGEGGRWSGEGGGGGGGRGRGSRARGRAFRPLSPPRPGVSHPLSPA